MQQIKLLQQTNNKLIDPESPLFSDNKTKVKRKKNDQQDLIQPWMEDSDNNPFLHLKSKQIKVKRESPKILRQTSINLVKNWKSVQRVNVNRQSKILPVMDIGQLNCIRRNYSHNKYKGKLDLQPLPQKPQMKKTGSSRQIMLPSVKRQLLMERKIFLLKNLSEIGSNNSSPVRSSRIRSIISDTKI